MKQIRALCIALFLIPCLSGAAQNKTTAFLTEAYRFESANSQLFSAYASQAITEGNQPVALFFKAIARAASVHADNFQKVLARSGTSVLPVKPQIVPRPTRENVEEAFNAVRMEAGIKYGEYLEQAKADGETLAAKALRWARETQQQSLQMYANVISALADGSVSSLPTLYWVCPKCGNLYDVPAPEKECSFCYTEREKFVKVSD